MLSTDWTRVPSPLINCPAGCGVTATLQNISRVTDRPKKFDVFDLWHNFLSRLLISSEENSPVNTRFYELKRLSQKKMKNCPFYTDV